MTYPSIRSSAFADAAEGSGTSHTVVLPATISAGDLLIVCVAGENTGAARTFSFPGGWTEILDVNSWPALAVAYKVADGTEDGTSITVTSSAALSATYLSAAIYDYSSTPEVQGANTTVASVPDPAAISPSWGSYDSLFIVYLACGSAGNPSAGPSGYSGFAVLGGAGDWAWAYKTATTASENPGVFTVAVNPVWSIATIAIKGPAAAASNGLFFGSNF